MGMSAVPHHCSCLVCQCITKSVHNYGSAAERRSGLHWQVTTDQPRNSMTPVNMMHTCTNLWKRKISFVSKFYFFELRNIREFHNARWSRWGQRWLRNELNVYFTYQSRSSLKSFTLFISVKTITELNLEFSDKCKTEIYTNISRCSSLSSGNAQFGHFTLLFCRGRQRNVPKL